MSMNERDERVDERVVDEQVVVVVPAVPRYVRLARLVAGGFATAHSPSMALVDDVRIAAGEVCGTLIQMSSGAPATLTFTLEGDAVRIRGWVEGLSDRDLDVGRLGISRQILEELSDGHELLSRLDGQGTLSVTVPFDRSS